MVLRQRTLNRISKFCLPLLFVLAGFPNIAVGLPGIIALDTQASSKKEVYVPDPVVLIHGVASNVQTYQLAPASIET